MRGDTNRRWQCVRRSNASSQQLAEMASYEETSEFRPFSSADSVFSAQNKSPLVCLSC